MAWNEPGGGNKDPWSGKGGDQGPPELDEVVRKVQEKLGGLFGGGKPGGGSSGSGPASNPLKGVGIFLGILFVIWMLSGWYIVDPAERGVVLRFGAYSEVTAPGPHWHFPYPIESVVKVDVDQISSFRHKAQMLTRDENIVDIELTVQSRIQDPADYLFQDRNPEKTLTDVTETAVRETIGKSNLDFILTEGRSSIANTIKERVQGLLNTYRTGLVVTSVNMQPAKPPEQVKAAFDDAIKAREDKERQENEAEAYANEVVPKARGAGARRVEDAKAYHDQVIAESEGRTSRFLAVLTEYEKAPEVTRERLYVDALEESLANSNKVLMGADNSNNLMYLPLDRLIGRGQEVVPTQNFSQSFSGDSKETMPKRDTSRSRRVR